MPIQGITPLSPLARGQMTGPTVATRYRPDSEMERALIVLDEHPNIRVNPKYTARARGYRIQREAAAADLAKGKRVYRDTMFNEVVEYAVYSPPSESATAGLREQLREAAQRHAKLNLNAELVDQDSFRGAFQAAAWLGYTPMVEVWAEWLNALRSAATHVTERERLEAVLCISAGTARSAQAPAPGTYISAPSYAGWPRFDEELEKALNRMPQDQAPAGAKGKGRS